MFKTVTYINPAALQSIGQKNGALVVVNFVHPHSALSKRAVEHLGRISEAQLGAKTLFLNSELLESEVDKFIDEYQFIRFPAVLLFMKDTEVFRFNSWKDLENLDLKIKEFQRRSS